MNVSRFPALWSISVYPWIFYLAGVRWSERNYLIASLCFSVFSFAALLIIARHDRAVAEVEA